MQLQPRKREIEGERAREKERNKQMSRWNSNHDKYAYIILQARARSNAPTQLFEHSIEWNWMGKTVKNRMNWKITYGYLVMYATHKYMKWCAACTRGVYRCTIGYNCYRRPRESQFKSWNWLSSECQWSCHFFSQLMKNHHTISLNWIYNISINYSFVNLEIVYAIEANAI